MTATYRRAESTPPVNRPCLHVTWARLAVLWWRDIAVTTAEPVELNELDDFIMSAVHRLGHLHAQAFERFTGLPPLVFHGLARRLHSLGLLEWRDGRLGPPAGPVRPQVDGPPRRTATTTLDFVYLPETDDLIVVEEGLAEWEKVRPKVVGAAPLPPTLRHLSVRTLLASRIEHRRVANLADSVIALAEGPDEPLTSMAGAAPQPPVPVCPVFEFAATVVLDEQRPEVTLEVTGAQRSSQPQTERDRRVTIDLSGATGLVHRWSQAIALAADEPDETANAMRALGLSEAPWPSLQSDPTGNWTLSINGQHARELARHALLTAPVGIEVRQRHARVVAALQLVPNDERAKDMVRLDSVLQDVLQNHVPQARPIGLHDQGIRDIGGISVLQDRAWQLKYYSLVHALREDEDFDYA